MLLFGVPFSEIWKKLHQGKFAAGAPVQFIQFLERRLGARFVFDAKNIPHGRADLIDLFELAASLREAKVIRGVHPSSTLPDEPPFKQWYVECATVDKHTAGGMALESDRDALIPALAEAVERFIWMTQTDYFNSPRTETATSIMQYGHALTPAQFVGFSEAQRAENRKLALDPGATYLWIRGHSFTRDASVWIPAQVVSGSHGIHMVHHGTEPTILSPITTGLATGPTREFALLNGALEILERDAFMITWLNQLTPPRIDIDALAKQDASIEELLHLCRRYRLSVSAVRLPTDAPAYAVCGIVQDESDVGPNVTIGLKAHRSFASAVKGACLEALRARQSIRFRDRNTPLDPKKEVQDIVHMERAQYWGVSGSAEKLAFLTDGPIEEVRPEEWESDSIEAHWQRIIKWCSETGYECAFVDMGKSSCNVTPWHIAMVVMPEMQPVHQTERFIYLGGDRLKDIPTKFGYAPRSMPFTDEPHPFA